MLNVPEFKAAMARKGYSQKRLANALGMSERTLSNRIKEKKFGSDEIEKLIPILEITEPLSIFFDSLVTYQDTKRI